MKKKMEEYQNSLEEIQFHFNRRKENEKEIS